MNVKQQEFERDFEVFKKSSAYWVAFIRLRYANSEEVSKTIVKDIFKAGWMVNNADRYTIHGMETILDPETT